jgi:uncharacterized protein involved in type VI secretion and phage assembly
MSSSPFSQLLDFVAEDNFGNRVIGLRYAEVDSVGEDGYVLNWLTGDADAPSSPARCATMMAGKERGTYFMPEPGDEVLVGFEGGDLDRPVIIGALWSDVDAPPATADTSKSNNVRSIVSRLGHQLTFDDTSGAGKVTLESADKFVLEMDDKGKKITLATPGGIKLELNDKDKKVTLQLDESTKIELSATGVSVKGSQINLN